MADCEKRVNSSEDCVAVCPEFEDVCGINRVCGIDSVNSIAQVALAGSAQEITGTGRINTNERPSS